MAVTLYTMSGSPYGWRVWLALVHKGIPHEIVTMSYDAGDFAAPGFAALNPRRRVPVIDHDGFVLYESAAILEYIAEAWPGEPPLFSPDLRQRAIERRLIREADQYFAEQLEHLVQAVFYTPPERRVQATVDAAWDGMRRELALWESLLRGPFLGGPLSAADFTLFPEIALGFRIAERNPGLVSGDLLGPGLAAWYGRMLSLPVVRSTWPPHWAPPPGP
jgi:glutathione S-transferase